MKKPTNFSKIDREVIKVGNTAVVIDITNNGFFVFKNGDAKSDWENCVLFEMDWESEKYNIKICLIGEGTDGWYLHQGLPIPKDLIQTSELFKEFVVTNMLGVASSVDLTDTTPNMAGVTELNTPEIKHTVASSSGPNVTYEVTENVSGIKDLWTCTCKAFQYSKEAIPTCKHIKLIKN